MTDIKDEILNDEQLEGVAGGTNAEYGGLCDAINQNPAFGAKMSGFGDLGNVQEILRDKLGIDAKINVNFGLLLPGQKPALKDNVYKDAQTGETLTHEDVLNRIAAYK